MPQITDWTIPGYNGQPILGNTHMPDDGPDAAVGVLLICHGFKGYKDYGFFPHLAQAAAKAGLIAHRFNFSHSGMTNCIETFERPDLFEQDTWGRQITDLAIVGGDARYRIFDFPNDDSWDARVLPLICFGHSRGGVTTLLTAARGFDNAYYHSLGATFYPPGIKPDAIVVAASPAEACSLDEDQKDMLKRVGSLVSSSGRTGQNLKVGRAWLDEIEAHPDQFDPVQAAMRIECPMLILHGDADSTVPVSAANQLAEAAKPHAKLQIIPSAGHTFNAPNPLPLDQTPPPETQQMIDAACGFALQHCLKK